MDGGCCGFELPHAMAGGGLIGDQSQGKEGGGAGDLYKLPMVCDAVECDLS